MVLITFSFNNIRNNILKQHKSNVANYKISEKVVPNVKAFPFLKLKQQKIQHW